MEYMLIIAQDPATVIPEPDTAEFDERMVRWNTFNQMLLKGNHWLGGGILQPASTATTIRMAPGADPLVSDGPFAETKEVFGGFYLIAAADLDEALALVRQIPIDEAAIEIRPVMYRPDLLA